LFLRIAILSAILFTLGVSAQTPQPEPKRPVEWFARAQNLMDLRTYDAAPFHLRVSFHAFPGNELLGPHEKPAIVTGDGKYEETWLGPHQWRREVKLSDYHAIEEESGRFRKMQASSDYEPLRVAMLMEALLYPIPRELTSQSSRYAKGWAMDSVTTGDTTLVRLAKTLGNQHATFTDAYFFLPSGALALANKSGLVTLREGSGGFSGKTIANHLSIKAGDNELLAADINIESVAATTTLAELAGNPAPAWMTLRPLHESDVQAPDPPHPVSGIVPLGSESTPVLSYQAMLDRQGKYREAETLLVLNLGVGATRLIELRKDHVRPAYIDGSPCQFLVALRIW